MKSNCVRLAAIALAFACAASAADFPPVQNGQYLLRQTQEWPPFSKPKAPAACDMITTLTVTNSASGAFVASLQDSFAGTCTTSPAPAANARTYHIQASGNMLCGMSYQSQEKDPSNAALPAAALNDYRNAPTSCTNPTQGPAIIPVISLQEVTAHGTTNWESYQ